MREALAETISRVRDSHARTCDLVGGSPSATVAAWRMTDEKLEYLVLSDASIVLLDRQDGVTEIVDHRLDDMMARAAPLDPERTAVTGVQVRDARRALVESTRNKGGGFWCVQTDTTAASQAMYDVVAVGDLVGIVACSDGGARAYELLGTHTLQEFADLAARGELEALSNAIRTAERNQAGHLQGLGLKVHDDVTVVALSLTGTVTPVLARDGL